VLAACTHDVQLPTRGDGADAPAGAAHSDQLGIYEAEDAFWGKSGVLGSVRMDFSGSGYVDALGRIGTKLTFTVQSPGDGQAHVKLRHAGPDKRVAVWVNGQPSGQANLQASDVFIEQATSVTLRKGLNTIAFVGLDESSAPLSVDRLELDRTSQGPSLGALVPFVTFEAESMDSNATHVGPDLTAGTLAANASGREAMSLVRTGDYVAFKLAEPANALSVRFSLPDAPEGRGTQGSLSLYVDGQKKQVLSLSSQRAWLYGSYDQNTGFSDDPSAGELVMPFIEERFLLDQLPTGARVELRRDATDEGTVTVDLVDAELVPPPYPQPAGSISIVDKGARAGDDADDSEALLVATSEAAALHVPVWIPAGDFTLGDSVPLGQVTVLGAGPAYTRIHGTNGKGGLLGRGDQVQVLDLSIFGDQEHRDNAHYASGIDGSLGEGSLIQNVWIQGTKAGIWLYDSDSTFIVGVRVRDTYADGVSLNRNVTHSALEHVHVRGSGDDGLELWAQGTAQSNRIRFCTVRSPWHANGVALYGGTDLSVQYTEVFDPVRNGAGIKLSTQYDPVPFGGNPVIEHIRVVRGGGVDLPNVWTLGALFFDVHDAAIDAPITVRDAEILESPHDGVLIADTNAVRQLHLERVAIRGSGGYGIHISTPGDGSFVDVTVSDATMGSSDISHDFISTKVGTHDW
jgi:hypothetical protein